MECNRDEANRAKELAESKFSAKDVMGAKKFALKAQNLYPGLDGISQLLAVLDVYVAVENKINGELDVYGILGVNPLADDDTLRKHYRKLALSLHPDKNKSIGAEGAFMYVSDAWNLLSDKDKRSAYDYRRNGRFYQQQVPTQNGGSRVPTPPTQNGFYHFTKCTLTRAKGTTPQTKVTIPQTKGTRKNTNATTKTGSTSVHPSPSKKTCPPPVPSSSRKKRGPTLVPSSSHVAPTTFWTVCMRCKLQYEFLRMYLNRNLLCPTCTGPFRAIETPPPNTNASSGVPKGQEASRNMSYPTKWKIGGTEPAHGGWGSFLKMPSPAPAPAPAPVTQAATMVQQAYARVKREREEAQAATKREEALRRKISKKAAKSSSKHSNSVKSKQDVDGFRANKETGPVGSSVSSPQVEVKKDISNASNIKNQLIKKATIEIRKKLHEWSSEPVKISVLGRVGATEKGDTRGKGNGKRKINSKNGNMKNHQSEPRVTDVPDPDFHDFDCNRTEKCFEEGQVWAAYDDHDEMPRHYAMIRKVISLNPFKMKVCWLDSESNDNPGLLLKAFGEFKAGKHETVSVPNYFSHKASFTKHGNGNIRVFPKKGDVCALYKNAQTPGSAKPKYEIVEVDEYDDEKGITITPLVKVPKFKVVFRRHPNPKETRLVSKNEIIQFSHQIPSYLLTGQDSPNAPTGCRELDPAAIPTEFLKVAEIMKNAENMKGVDDDKDCVLADFKEADEGGSK